MEDRARIRRGNRRRLFGPLVLVARECVERNLRNDGGAGGDSGIAFERALDGDCGQAAALQRFRSRHFCEDYVVHNGGHHTSLGRRYVVNASRTDGHAREVLPESAPANHRMATGSEARRRWTHHARPGKKSSVLTAGLRPTVLITVWNR